MISRYHGTVTRVKRKNRNGAGSLARLRKDGRYEARATLNTTTGRRRVSFYGATTKEAEEERLQARADQAEGIVFSDPGKLTVTDYLQVWLHDTARYQVREKYLQPLRAASLQSPPALLRPASPARPHARPRPRLQGPQAG